MEIFNQNPDQVDRGPQGALVEEALQNVDQAERREGDDPTDHVYDTTGRDITPPGSAAAENADEDS